MPCAASSNKKPDADTQRSMTLVTSMDSSAMSRIGDRSQQALPRRWNSALSCQHRVARRANTKSQHGARLVRPPLGSGISAFIWGVRQTIAAERIGKAQQRSKLAFARRSRAG